MGTLNAEQVMYNHFGYRTPVGRLYMAGSATHPGGAISGGGGYISRPASSARPSPQALVEAWDAGEALAERWRDGESLEKRHEAGTRGDPEHHLIQRGFRGEDHAILRFVIADREMAARLEITEMMLCGAIF